MSKTTNNAKVNTIIASANTALVKNDIEKAFEVMDKLHATAEKADQTAALAWASILLIAKKHNIKTTVIAERYGVSKDYINLVLRGAQWLDTGKISAKGVPVLGVSPFAVVENGKAKDYTLQKLSRLSGLGNVEEIKKFIAEKGITPDISQADLIKAISEYKNPKKTEEKPKATEEVEASAETAIEETAEATKNIIDDTFAIFEITFKNIQQCKLIAKGNSDGWAELMDKFVELVKAEDMDLVKANDEAEE